MKLKITVDGHLYEVDVEVSDPKLEGPSYYPPMHARMPASPSSAGAAAPRPKNDSSPVADESKVCRSPLSGTVFKVETAIGESIAENDVLMVLEAMKMETVITAPYSGTVKAINAAVGEAVKQGQVLIEID
jgi:biotin carboxyl carrier protein